MNDIQFYKSFLNSTLRFKEYRHADNSGGIGCHYLARLNRGSARIVTLRGEELKIAEGDIFYLPNGLCYHSHWYGDSEGVIEWNSFGFTHLPDKSGTLYKMQIIPKKEGLSERISALAAEEGVTLAYVGGLYSLLAELMPDMARTEKDKNAALLAEAEDYILRNPDFKVSELARYCNMSESGLYAFFRRTAGTTPIGMKNAHSVRRAVLLLRSTDTPIEELSESLGFSTSAYFRRVIKQHTGKTPSEIRRAAKTI
jgi:AraC-like DNA-binding protein